MAKTVLIVDDSMVARMSIKAALKDSGAAISEASSGEDALEKTGAGLRPDIVFLDLTMPGMGGVEALRGLKNHLPDVPVVVVTADQQAQTLEEVRRLDPFCILPKPADRDAILKVFGLAMEGADGEAGGVPG